MTRYYDYELGKISKTIISDMLDVKEGETVIITSDTGSNPDVVQALGRHVFAVGAKPMCITLARPYKDMSESDPYLPSNALIGALCGADVWIEAQSIPIIYSNVMETVLKENHKIRYFVMADPSVEILDRMFARLDVKNIIPLIRKIAEMTAQAKKIRVQSKLGTNIEFETDPNHYLAVEDGNMSQSGFYSVPPLINVVPKFGTVNGCLVGETFYQHKGILEHPITFQIKNGEIVDIQGTKSNEIKEWIDGFNDPNLNKVAHMNYGLNPNVTKLYGHIIPDERVWGATNWGFGYVSPFEAPPDGQKAASHFDTLCKDCSIWVDNVQIFENGQITHPELLLLVNKVKVE